MVIIGLWHLLHLSMVTNNTAYGPYRKSVGSKIHHNYIHNNLQNGMGYGGDVQSKEVKIYANMFPFE